LPYPHAIPTTVLSPLTWVGRRTLDVVSDMGRMVTLLALSARSLVRPVGPAPPFRPALVRELAALLALGFPLVGFVHVGLGSFMSLQAYFGGTFVDGTGAVVGVGLFRNVAPLMAGMTMAGLIAVRTTFQLRGRSRAGLDGDPLWVADRDVSSGLPGETRVAPEPGRLAAVRIGAAMVAGPILALWGTLVGTLVGWQVAGTVLGVSTHAFFSMMWEMLWLRDIAGLIIKGSLYTALAALFACHEGLRGPAGPDPEPDPDAVPPAIFRAVCLTAAAILVVNSGWFLLVYHAGPAFGPTLMAPQGG
jgi:phospholipid/cholesterol/gamma-HCH transport system permease protein